MICHCGESLETECPTCTKLYEQELEPHLRMRLLAETELYQCDVCNKKLPEESIFRTGLWDPFQVCLTCFDQIQSRELEEAIDREMDRKVDDYLLTKERELR